jgi:hypothetical protein
MNYRLSMFALALFGAPGLVLAAKDRDGDGLPDKMELPQCVNDAEDVDEWDDMDGCPEPDNDMDGVCDAWVAEKGQLAKYVAVCKGADKCNTPGDPRAKEDMDGFEDEDGCPDLDNDQDGLPDAKDKCPSEAEDKDGFDDFDGCPELDNDKDGVTDDKDKCPMESEDFDGFEDTDGCPDSDNDKDGIPDQLDKCPNEPETMNGKGDEDGCPDADADPLPAEKELPARFKTGEAELTVEGQMQLEQEVLPGLRAWPTHQLEITVYSVLVDEEARPTYSQKLAERQESVKAFFVSKGIAPERLSVTPIMMGEEALRQTKDALVLKRK